MDMRGLSHFIRDIRATTGNKRMEEIRVQEELAKIRAKFIDEGHMTLYDRKKYVCKLMFIAMLGYPVLFGHLEGLKLMAEETPSEKLIGYLSITVLLNENSPLMEMATHTIYRDLLSGLDFNRGLALTAIANAGSKAFVEVMHNGVQDIVLKDSNNTDIIKKAVLTLLCIYRKYPEIVDLRLTIEKLSGYIESENEGLVMACVSFMQGCISKENLHLFSGIRSYFIRAMAHIINDKKTDPGNVYYGVSSPWMQCKLLRLLQFFNPPENPSELNVISSVLRKILRGTEKVLAEAQTQVKQRGTTNRVNAMLSILFEVVLLVIHWQMEHTLVHESVAMVGRFVTTKRGANMRYIGLSLLSRLSAVKEPEFDFPHLCKQYEQNVVVALHDSDVSLRLQALNVLVAMCNDSNVGEIVKELLSYLPIAGDSLFRVTLLLSIASLAEKYFERSSSQYVDVMLTAVADAGDLCPPNVIERITHTVVNHSQVQKRAVTVGFKSLKGKGYKNEAMIRVAAFFIGEYGCQIALNPESTPIEQVSILRKQLPFVSEQTQAVLLHSLIKLYNVYGNTELRAKIIKILKSFSSRPSLQLQQYCVEYLAIIEHSNPSLLNHLLESMPPFPEDAGLSTVDRTSPYRDGKQASRDSFQRRDELKKNKAEVLPLKKLLEAVQSSKGTAEDEPTVPLHEVFQVSHRSGGEKEIQENALNSLLFKKMLRNEGSILYRNDDIQISCQQKYLCADARLTLTIKSLKDSGKVGQPEVAIAFVDAGLILEFRILESSDSLMDIEFAARSAYPYNNPPTIRLAYTVDDVTQVKMLCLPVTTTRFIAPCVTHSDPLENLVDNARSGTTLISGTVSCRSQCTPSVLREALSNLGYSVLERKQVNDREPVCGVGLHSTSPSALLQCSTVVCELQLQHPGEICVSIYTRCSSLARSILSFLDDYFDE